MEAEDPLSELADIHLPGEVGLWPPALGWWIIAVLMVAALVLAGRRLFALLVQRRREAAALAELEQSLGRFRAKAAFDAERNQAGLDYLAEVNAILRRVALVHYPDTDVAGLHGSAWLAFLDAHGGGDDFSAGPGKALGEGQYRRVFDADAEGLYEAARRWVRARYRGSPARGPNSLFREARA